MTNNQPISQSSESTQSLRAALADVRRQLAAQDAELSAATAVLTEHPQAQLDIDPTALAELEEATEVPLAFAAAPPPLGIHC